LHRSRRRRRGNPRRRPGFIQACPCPGEELISVIIVTHGTPLFLRIERIAHKGTPAGQAAVAWLHEGTLVARGLLPEDALPALQSLLQHPVALALAAKEDGSGNIDGRVCLVLPVRGEDVGGDDDDAAEPWKSSVPAPAWESQAAPGPEQHGDLALLPIGNVVRSAANRNHADVAGDAREMLANLLTGQARDAVDKAIDDLLGSL
jgi:hypothetical protein